MYKIIAIEYKEQMTCVHFDNDVWIEIPTIIFYDYNLQMGRVITQENYDELLQAKTEYGIKQYINRILARKDITSYELIHLIQDHYSLEPQRIQELIAPYQKNGLINDERYLQEHIQGLLSKNYGYRKIINYLEIKGFAKEAIDNLFDNTYRDLEYKQAQLVAQKYLKQKQKSNEKRKRGLIQKLLYCGYSDELIQQILRESKFVVDDF